MCLRISFTYKKNFLTDRRAKKIFKEKISSLIHNIAFEEEKNFSTINLVFCSDEFIKQYNKKFLNHDYKTDIITFYDKDDNNLIEGELLISVDMVKSNSLKYKVSFENELTRVIIHGILHLCGYNDEAKSEKIILRKRENFYLKHK